MTLSQLASSNRAMTAHDYVLSTIRKAILNGDLPGGTRLIQAELASQLDVSITPVREALRDLTSEGLVVFDPHRGSHVRSLDLAEVRELYELRVTLEPLMIRRHIDAVTSEQLDRAETILNEMEETDDISSWTELNRQFHSVLAEHNVKSRLALILTGLRDSASGYVSISLAADIERRAQSHAEHRRLVKLYRDRDVEGIVELTVQHLRTTLATIESAYEKGRLT